MNRGRKAFVWKIFVWKGLGDYVISTLLGLAFLICFKNKAFTYTYINNLMFWLINTYII